MKRKLITITLLWVTSVVTHAQSTCEQKLKNAKNSIVAIINSGGGNDKVNQTAVDIMTNMAINCPESIKEFNKFIEDLGKKGNTEGLDGKVQGTYQSSQERQKNYDKFGNDINRNSGGQNTSNNTNADNTIPGRTSNNQTGMRGDGYAELPFKDGEDDNTTIYDKDNSGKSYLSGAGISGKAIQNQRQVEQERNQAQNQIKNGKGGFEPVRNREDLIAPKPGSNIVSEPDLNTEIKNFENKLAQVPENLKPDLLAKANHILRSETNKQEAARKLASLMKDIRIDEALKTDGLTYYKNYFKSKGFNPIIGYGPTGKKFFISKSTNNDFNYNKHHYFKIISSNPNATDIQKDFEDIYHGYLSWKDDRFDFKLP